ncbi:hypothetical protein, partial [Xanthomonas campestris]|uniref:hypothetical protein n=1 Tax=Xanthomonas campestris TaxID=339 RepID=UPI002FCD96FE
ALEGLPASGGLRLRAVTVRYAHTEPERGQDDCTRQMPSLRQTTECGKAVSDTDSFPFGAQ